MARFYARHTSLKGIISFAKIAELWDGSEISVNIKGVEIVIYADDMGNVIADTPQSLAEDGGTDALRSLLGVESYDFEHC